MQVSLSVIVAVMLYAAFAPGWLAAWQSVNAYVGANGACIDSRSGAAFDSVVAGGERANVVQSAGRCAVSPPAAAPALADGTPLEAEADGVLGPHPYIYWRGASPILAFWGNVARVIIPFTGVIGAVSLLLFVLRPPPEPDY